MYYVFVRESIYCFATAEEYQLVVPELYEIYQEPIDVVPERKLTEEQRAVLAEQFYRVLA